MQNRRAELSRVDGNSLTIVSATAFPSFQQIFFRFRVRGRARTRCSYHDDRIKHQLHWNIICITLSKNTAAITLVGINCDLFTRQNVNFLSSICFVHAEINDSSDRRSNRFAPAALLASSDLSIVRVFYVMRFAHRVNINPLHENTYLWSIRWTRAYETISVGKPN